MGKPDIAALGNWLCSWIQENGAIYGFHNHSVWGCNPYTYRDDTCGHSAFAAPLMGALSLALQTHGNRKGKELLKKMICYQAASFQGNGQFKHIGFQVGEAGDSGLIHNQIAQIGLLLAGVFGKGYLTAPIINTIREAVEKNIEGCKVYGGGRAGVEGTCNQEYARIWAKLLYMELFNEHTYDKEVTEDLQLMIELFHKQGFPDEESTGVFRSGYDKTAGRGILEPAEYYGLMICPLLMAYHRYGNESFLTEAGRLCRHIIRSSWLDERGCRRLHRYWYIDGEKKQKSNSPMLIAGMGITLYAINEYLKIRDDLELDQFLQECGNTYQVYQTGNGCFFSATGWHNEMDVAPCSSWHAHDLLYLISRYGVSENFWEMFFAQADSETILLTDRCFWAERSVHWCIRNTEKEGDYYIYGRKDKNQFGRDYYKWTNKPTLPKELGYPEEPVFIQLNDGIYRLDCGQDSCVYSIAEKPYRGQL